MKYQQAVEYYIDYRLYFYLENTGYEVTDKLCWKEAENTFPDLNYCKYIGLSM